MNLLKFYIDAGMRDLTSLGTVGFHALLLLFLLLFGQYALFAKILAGELLVYIIAVIFKLGMFRERPKKMQHAGVLQKIEAGSFPSVHTARIFLVAVFGMAVFHNLPAAVLAAIVALTVAYSRIYLKKHYLVDVVAGAIIGSAVALFLLML